MVLNNARTRPLLWSLTAGLLLICPGPCWAAEPAVAPAAGGFQAKKLERTYDQRLSAPAAKVFALLSPLAEKEWALGWDPEFLHCSEDCRGVGTLFRTTSASGATTLWYLRELDNGPRRLEYLIVRPEICWTILRIQVEEVAGGSSVAHIAYTWLALSPNGNEYVDLHAGPHFDEYMQLWERSLNYYLGNGKALPESRQLVGAKPSPPQGDHPRP